MITWKLWTALYRPPLRHPIFQRIITTPLKARRWRRKLIWMVALILCYIGYQISFRVFPVGLILFSLTIQDVIVLFVAFNLIYGCVLVTAVSQTITNARDQGYYDVLCLIPDGESGVTWVMSIGALYRGWGLNWFRIVVLLISGIPLIALTIHLVIPILLWGHSFLNGATSADITRSYQQMILDLTSALALIGAFFTGCVQSIVLSVLVGMLLPATMRGSGTPVWALGTFLLLQIISFLLTSLFGLLILPVLPGILQVGGWWVGLSTPVWLFTFFFGVRELINLLLWRALSRQWYNDFSLI